MRILASQERLQYVASFGDKKEYIALIEQQLNKARYIHPLTVYIHVGSV